VLASKRSVLVRDVRATSGDSDAASQGQALLGLHGMGRWAPATDPVSILGNA
jgi:hypothetical protein